MKFKITNIILVSLGAFFGTLTTNGAPSNMEVLAWWRFEKIQHLAGDSTSISIVGQPLKSSSRGPAEPQPFVYDDSGKNNMLQSQGAKSSTHVFSDNVPYNLVEGKQNTRSLTLKDSEYVVPLDRSLPYYDMGKGWTIEASLLCNLLGTEQVYLCKEGARGQIGGDISIGFDNMLGQFFVEVMCFDGELRRVSTGDKVVAGVWYDIRAQAIYNTQKKVTELTIEVKPSINTAFTNSASITFKGLSMVHNAGQWIIGRGYPGGFPNSLSVLDGGIDEVRISGESMSRSIGQNPIFNDAFTADPAALVVDDKVYVYVGHDTASPGGWFNMPEWLCYSTSDMKTWTAHGPVLAAKDFQGAYSNSSWAAQVVEKEGKYYFYVTLERKEGHFITVAVGDSPLGPFKEVSPGKPLITDDMTTDSHRNNADIDPTVIFDDEGTPWMAWGNGDCYMVRLKQNMVELDGLIMKVPFRNYSEGPWLFKHGNLYYNIYAADAPGVQSEQICYSTAENIIGPWTYRGFVTGPAKHGFTIHPAVIQFKKQWYFFYHDGSYSLNGLPGGDCRRQICLEYLRFNPDGTIKPITLTTEGVSVQVK